MKSYPISDPYPQSRAGIAPIAPTDRTRTSNIGVQVTILGSNEKASEKVIRVDDDSAEQVPWLMGISSLVTPTSSTDARANIISPIIKGFFGTGSASQVFELDARPDSILSLPGTTVDASVFWDRIVSFLHSAGGADSKILVTSIPGSGVNALPASAIVTSSIKHGSPATPNATRTIIFTQDAGTHLSIFPTPPFSDSVILYLQSDAAYAGLGSLAFYANAGIGTGQIVSYTGAQVLAFKNAGVPIPIPGSAQAVGLQSAAPLDIGRACYLQFYLNL